MKYNMFKLGSYTVAAALLLAGCKSGSNGSYSTDEATGIQYRFLKQTNSANKASLGGVARVTMVGKTEKDSIIYNSVKQGGDSLGTFRIPLKKSFNGCLEQGIAMMAEGDSADFKINADSLYLSTFKMKKLPPFITHSGSFITFSIKLVSFETEKQATDERNQMMAKRMADMQKRKGQEPVDIAKYLSDHKYTAKPSPDSLFFLATEGKSGKAIKDGDSVYVKYTLYNLNGDVLETSDHGPGRNYYPVVYSQDMHVIRGWVEALGMMHDGEKAKVLLPSGIAYGQQGSRSIMPYTPLVFDLEILKVTSPKK